MSRPRVCALSLVLSGLSLVLSACSYTFDDTAPELPLVGEPPDMSRYPRLNVGPVDDAYIVRGVNNTFWAVMLEPGDLVRVRKLSDPPAEEELRGSSIFIRPRAFYAFERDPAGKEKTRLHVRSAGDPTAGAEFLLPPGDGSLYTGPYDLVFMYWIKSKDSKTFDVYRRDGSYHRVLPVPAKVDPRAPLSEGGFYDWTGDHLYIRDGNSRLVGYSTRDEKDIDLGEQPPSVTLLDDGVLACDDKKGLRVSFFVGGDPRVLDASPCNDSAGPYFGENDTILYLVGDQMRQVPLDGSAAPKVIFDQSGKQILAFGPESKLIYSTTPRGEFRNNASNGYLGDWQFMERGRWVTFSVDNKRLRWLEHAANLVGSGDLLSAEIPGGAPQRLARNVISYSELRDRRILAVSNYAFWGTQNRIIAIDEDRHESRWVADSASAFQYIPGSNDLLVYVTLSTGVFDVVRVPIPPKLP